MRGDRRQRIRTRPVSPRVPTLSTYGSVDLDVAGLKAHGQARAGAHQAVDEGGGDVDVCQGVAELVGLGAGGLDGAVTGGGPLVSPAATGGKFREDLTQDARLEEAIGLRGEVIPALPEVQPLPGRQLAEMFLDHLAQAPEALDVGAVSELGQFIEVKCGREILPELRRVLQRSGLEPDRVTVISFNEEVLPGAKALLPGVRTLLLRALKRRESDNRWEPTPADLAALAGRLGARGLDLAPHEAIDRDLLAACRGAGLELYAWTVDEVEPAGRLAALGVDGITTNRPGRLRRHL